MKRGKKYKKAVEFLEFEKKYTVLESIDLLEKTNTVKYDPTVELHYNLNLDPKHADQIVRATTSLPNGTGKVVKICVFTDSGKEKELKALGAKVVGWEELVWDIEKWNISLDFDICVANPAMMRKLWKIAKILWPKGLMPNPKSGTVWEDLEKIVKEIAGWRIELKTDKQWNLHTIFWKLSFGKDKLKQNLDHLINFVQESKPTWAKGKFIEAAYVCNAMWPSIELDI